MSPAGSRTRWAALGQGWTIVLVIGVLLAANLTLILGRHTGRFDAADFFCPYFILIADHARHGQLLLWTPLVECGCPAGFDPELGAMSPLTVGLAAVLGPSECAFRIYWLVIWGLGGLGVLFFARHLRAPAWMASAAAIGYMFSAAFTGQAEYMAYLVVMALLPWTLWRLDAALDERRWLPAAQAGALWGLAALAGYPGLIIIGECYLAAWVLGRWICAKGDRRMAGDLRRLILFAVVSLGAMAPVYFGFFHEMRGYTDRSRALPREEAISAQALDAKALSTFASPYVAIVGATRPKRLWTTDIAMCSIYLSPVLLLLGLAALWLRPRDAFRWWLAGMGVLCLAAALGDQLPLRGWLYDALPPMRYFRHAAMFRCYYLVTVVVLAIFAGRDLADSAAGRATVCWKRLAIVCLAMAPLALATLAAVCWAAQFDRSDIGTVALAAVHGLLVWLGTAVLAILAWRIANTSAFGPLLVVLCILDGVLTMILGRPAIYTKRSEVWPAVEKLHRSSIDLDPQGLDRVASWTAGPVTPLNGCLVVKVPVLRCFNVLRNKLYEEETEDRVLAAGMLGSDRTWFASRASLQPLSATTLRRLAAQAETLGSPCLVVSDPPARDPSVGRQAPLATGPLVLSVEKLPAAERLP
ncbi:MAG: hypothetical protein ACLQLG_03160, partial [Thermoguttaceae bacterium]